MPKSQVIDPKNVRKSGQLEFDPIPVNQYKKTVKQESKNFTKEEFLRIQRDMCIIREFESMLNEIKMVQKYKGIEYNHKGPAHLSMGQESAAVGQAFMLDVNDHIFGSHRSHGEILAKGLSAIVKINDDELMNIMKTYFDGATLKVIEGDADGSVKDLANDYLIYGALAEIFHREAGFNKGLGGSMHAFFPPFGIFPNNAIVGGSGDISVGAALFKHVNQKPGIVIGNIGDASAGCGPVWEGLCFANMDQYKKLWDEAHRGGLPLILNFFNNFYGMGGQPVGETMGFEVLARLGAGMNPEQMHAERVDGYNPLAVIDAIKRKKKIIEEKRGPVLLDTITYRYSGHSPSDASSYRTKEELELWKKHDPIDAFAKEIVDAKVATQAEVDAVKKQAEDLVMKAFKKAMDNDISPRVKHDYVGCLLDETMYSNKKVESYDPERTADVLMPKGEDPRSKMLVKRSRTGVDENGKPLPKSRCIAIRDSLFEAIRDGFYRDATLCAYGEENRDWGGAFAVYRGLTECIPYHRLFNSPISEAAIVGTAVGYGLEGGRVIAELMYCDFMGRAGDEIFNQMSKWQSMSGGILQMPVILRVSVGSKYGAQHSQDWSVMCAHIPGLKVVFPATPYDAKGMMNAALTGTDPVIFFESQRLYDMPEMFEAGGVPEEYYEVEFGEPAVRKEGNDLTILTVGATLYRALDAAKELEEKYGISCEVIDARSMVPFNYDKVIESVKKTRKILLASDACERGSFLHTMASTISQMAFDELDAPPTVLGAKNWITPGADDEEIFFPYPEDFLNMIHEHIIPLNGYTSTKPCDLPELKRRTSQGL